MMLSSFRTSASTCSTLTPTEASMKVPSRHAPPSKHWFPPLEPVDLSPQLEFDLLDRIEDTVQFVLESLGPGITVVTNWKVKARRNGMSFYEDHTLHDKSPSAPLRYCCVDQTNASVEELMTVFVGLDNDSLMRNARIMHNKVVDTKLIAMLKPPSVANLYATSYVKYTRIRSSRWRRDRDLCCVVATNVFQLRDGSTIGYCLWDSVDIEECPDLTRSQGVQRVRMTRSGYVMRNSGLPNAKTKIIYLCGLDRNSGFDSSLGSSRGLSTASSLSSSLGGGGGGSAISGISSTNLHGLDEIGGNLELICAHFRRKPLDVNQFAPKSEWSSTSSAKFCCSCNHTFSLLSRRYNCMACGEVMCHTCCRKETVDLPGVGLKGVRICAFCVRGLGESHRQTTRADRAASQAVLQPYEGRISSSSTSSEDNDFLDLQRSDLPSNQSR